MKTITFKRSEDYDEGYDIYVDDKIVIECETDLSIANMSFEALWEELGVKTVWSPHTTNNNA